MHLPVTETEMKQPTKKCTNMHVTVCLKTAPCYVHIVIFTPPKKKTLLHCGICVPYTHILCTDMISVNQVVLKRVELKEGIKARNILQAVYYMELTTNDEWDNLLTQFHRAF